MRVKKFEGATMRDAIAKVKAELGDQAVIISTRQVRRGLLGSAVEISAAVDAEGDDAEQTMSGPTTGGPVPSQQSRNDQDLEKLIAPLRSELRSLRALVRTSGDNRGTTEMRSEIAALRKLVEELARPQPAAAPAAPQPAARRRATTQHDARPARTTQPGDTPLTAPSAGSAVMLVGPTGAGKTTTIAKIAARAALIDGRRVALVTLDNYRVGGVEQIRTFADLIGIPLEVAEDPAALGELIDPANDLTLIDTAGRSPRDAAAIVELAGHIAGLDLEVHLVVPAGSTPAQVDELVGRYSLLGPSRLLFTKLDECDRAPELALAPTRTGLPITWVTTGQAVPEDIEQPTPARVLELASGGLASPQGGVRMTDQAATLRVIQGDRSTRSSSPVPRRAIAVSGGKGGVGKSTVALNLAIAYSQLGARTLMVDTDLGMADLNLLLGVAPEKSLLDALSGTPVDDVLISAHGIALLPALNGSYLLSTIGPSAQRRVLDLVNTLAERFDCLVVDIAAGIGQVQTTFTGATSDAIVVVNPEPLSMADAYACLKTLATQQDVRHAYILPNRVTSRAQANELTARLGALVARFLELEITALPPVPADPQVAEAAQYGVPLMIHAPDCPAARAIRQLTRALSSLAPRQGSTWWRTARAQGDSR